jgi:uncharacterized lipoprotein YddW (UPF0748 family)
MRIGTWTHFAPKTKAEADKLVGDLAERGVNCLITSFKNWTGPTFYPSKIAYTEEGFEDPTLYGHLIDRCHQEGLEFEAWTCTFPESGRSKLLEEHPECRVMTADGEEYRVEGNGIAWACPASDLTQEYELGLCREVLEMYPQIDALHLDYIRYPAAEVCRCRHCQEEFQARYGYDLLQDNGQDGVASFDAYVRWRCGQIRRFVERAVSVTRRAGVRLSAAVFPFYPSIMYDMGQDWVDWCRSDLLDDVYPMNYNCSDRMVGRYTQMHALLLNGTTTQLCEGLTANAGVSGRVLQQIGGAALDNGAEGLIFFSADGLLRGDKDVLRPLIAG